MSSPTPTDHEYAYFQATGVFDPVEITRLLGVEPDDCWAVGDEFTRRGHTRKRRSSSWEISSGLEDSQRLNDHIAALLDKLESKQPSLLKAATFAKLKFVCVGRYVYNFSWEPDFEHQRKATSLGIGFRFDIYLNGDPHEEMVEMREQLGIRQELPEQT